MLAIIGKKLGPRYAVYAAGGSREFKFSTPSINTRSTSFVVLPMVEISAVIAVSTLSKLVIRLLAIRGV